MLPFTSIKAFTPSIPRSSHFVPNNPTPAAFCATGSSMEKSASKTSCVASCADSPPCANLSCKSSMLPFVDFPEVAISSNLERATCKASEYSAILSAFFIRVSSLVVSLKLDCSIFAYFRFFSSCSISSSVFLISSAEAPAPYPSKVNASVVVVDVSFVLILNSFIASPSLSTECVPEAVPFTRELKKSSAS